MREIDQFLLLSTAAIKTNMAKRIFYSLIPKMIGLGNEAQIYHTQGAVDYKFLKQMIPIAKELVHYGLMAAEEEAVNYYLGQNDIQKDLEGKSDLEKLKILVTAFHQTNNWAAQYGGGPWARIAETLYKIQHHLTEAEKNARNYDEPEKFYQELMQVVAYMNVLDGLAHNTASIIDKLITLEAIENPELYGGIIPENISDIERLMDAKELPNENDVLAEIYPILEKSDAPLVMKDWMSKARQQRHEFNDPVAVERRERQLQAIRKKKEHTEMLESRKKSMNFREWLKVINQPDNKILRFVGTDEFRKNITSFTKLASSNFYGSISNNPEITKVINQINSLTKLEPRLLDYHEARQLLSNSIQLIELLDRSIEENFDRAMVS